MGIEPQWAVGGKGGGLGRGVGPLRMNRLRCSQVPSQQPWTAAGKACGPVAGLSAAHGRHERSYVASHLQGGYCPPAG
eukprot:363597-Chlamydomonas_euryale.AAC.10